MIIVHIDNICNNTNYLLHTKNVSKAEITEIIETFIDF